jgi:hypothetical protein
MSLLFPRALPLLAGACIATAPYAAVIADDGIYVNASQNVREEMELEGYQPLGVRIAPLQYMAYPEIGLTQQYESNVFRDPSGEQSDFITSVQPGIRLQSYWKNHQLNVSARGDIGRYADNNSEDYEDVWLGADGRLDIRRGTYLTGEAEHASLHEFRGSPNDLGGDAPPTFDRDTVTVGFTHEPGLISISTNATFTTYDYDENVPRGAAPGAAVMSNAMRCDWPMNYPPATAPLYAMRSRSVSLILSAPSTVTLTDTPMWAGWHWR